MLSFANCQKDGNKRLQALTHAMNHFSSLQDCQFVHQQIKLQVELLKRQITIDEFDEKTEKKGDEIYKKFPRKNIGFSLVGSTLNQTLYYCFFYHPLATIDKLSSPLSLQKLFDVFHIFIFVFIFIFIFIFVFIFIFIYILFLRFDLFFI